MFSKKSGRKGTTTVIWKEALRDLGGEVSSWKIPNSVAFPLSLAGTTEE